MDEFCCPSCKEDFEAEGRFGNNVECPHCHKIFETDWDNVGEGISVWIGKEVPNESR